MIQHSFFLKLNVIYFFKEVKCKCPITMETDVPVGTRLIESFFSDNIVIPTSDFPKYSILRTSRQKGMLSSLTEDKEVQVSYRGS